HEEWEPDIFIVDDVGEEIKAVEESLPSSTVLLYHFHVLRSWRRKLNYHQ
ncbi:20091_t:CDS:1, partial [Racocetra persica]